VPYGTATGDGIYGLVQQSYSAFGTPGLTKQFMMVRPNFLSLIAPGSQAGVKVNYALADRDFSPIYPVGGVSQWNVGVWGSAVWTSAPRAFSDWVGVSALGHSGGVVLQTASIGDTVLSSIDYMLRSGGPL